MERPIYCGQCAAKLPEEAQYCPSCGAPVPDSETIRNIPPTQADIPGGKNLSPKKSDFLSMPEEGWFFGKLELKKPWWKTQYTCSNVGCIMLLILFLLVFLAAFPGYMPPKNRSMFTACVEQLSNVKTGAESFMTENDTLKGANIPDDFCNHILPGFDEAAQCRGLIQERVDGKGGVCAENTFSAKTIDGFNYEIQAQSQEKKQCKICVTEFTITPESYDECSKDMKYKCEHAPQ